MIAGNSSPSPATTLAFATVAVILARLRTIPGSASSRATSDSSNAATRPGSKPAKAARGGHRHAPLRVVVVDVLGHSEGPGTAQPAVGPGPREAGHDSQTAANR